MELIDFDFNGTLISATTINGEPWFVAKYVCNALELDDVNKACSRLDDDEKSKNSICTPGGMQKMIVINESGLYSLILTSRKPKAKAFKKWVTSEALPSIRKTNSYSIKHKTPLELAKEQVALYESIEAKEKALQIAIATKAEIDSRREATSMATASVAVRERNKALEQLGTAKSMATIRAVNKATNEHFQFKPLKDYCKAKELDIGYAVDPLYGEVRTYPAQAWLEVYGVCLDKLFN